MKKHFVPATDCVEWQAAPRSLPVVTARSVKLGWLPHWKRMALYVIPNRRAGARGQCVLWLEASGGINAEKTHKSLRLDALASPICPKSTRKWKEWLGDHDWNYHFETDGFWYCIEALSLLYTFSKTLSNRHTSDRYWFKSIHIMHFFYYYYIFPQSPPQITCLSKWFHKEPLTSEEPFCFTKGSLWRKKVLQIIKR